MHLRKTRPSFKSEGVKSKSIGRKSKSQKRDSSSTCLQFGLGIASVIIVDLQNSGTTQIHSLVKFTTFLIINVYNNHLVEMVNSEVIFLFIYDQVRGFW